MPDNDAVIAAPVAAPDAPKDVMTTSTIAVETPVKEQSKTVETPPDSGDITPNADKTPPKDAPKWFQERFNEMTKTNRTLEREKAALIEQNAQVIAQLAAVKKGDTPGVPPVADTLKPLTPVQPVQDIDTLVNERVALMKFNSDCDKIAAEGKKEFADFDNAIGILNQVGLIDAPDKPQTFLQVATTLENPHKVMHYLGSNPDEAARLRSLDQVGLARELTRLEFKLNQPKNVSVSNAPPPIKPINGVAKGEIDVLNPPKDMSMDEWVAANRKRRQAARIARKY